MEEDVERQGKGDDEERKPSQDGDEGLEYAIEHGGVNVAGGHLRVATNHRDQQNPGDEKRGGGYFSLEAKMAARMTGQEEDEGEEDEDNLQNVLCAGEILGRVNTELDSLPEYEETEEDQDCPPDSHTVTPGLEGKGRQLRLIARTDRGRHTHREAGVVGEDVGGQHDHHQTIEQNIEVVEERKSSPFQLQETVDDCLLEMPP